MLRPLSQCLFKAVLDVARAGLPVTRDLQDILGGEMPPLDESIVISGDRVRFTLRGHRYFGPLFRKVGISIIRVKTLAQFHEACSISLAWRLERAAAWMNRHRPPTDEHKLLIAIIRGDPEDQERLERKLARKARLTLVKSKARGDATDS